MKISRILLLASSILVISCHKNVNNTIDLEKKVFDDVFQSTVDSTLIDLRTYTGFQYSKKQRDSIKKDTLHRVVAFTINNYIASDDFLSDSSTKYKLTNDSVWNFKLEKYNSSKYNLKNSDELPFTDTLTEWKNKYPKFSGGLSFSKIYFDDAKETGIFEVTYYCGPTCGLGYSVYVKKINNKWTILKVERIWIS
ncbi:MAG: hypothetical protein ACN6OB_12710 [Chryseobacterium jejuense]|uniref:hypothetical protein n=1 Tax=Chryseobacterium jejuense TaxID=445960 RepID=UPI003D120580